MKFNTIGIITKPEAETARRTLQTLCEFLKTKNCKVILDQSIPDTVNDCDFKKASREEIGNQCDLAIVVGGDGTILNAVRSLTHTHRYRCLVSTSVAWVFSLISHQKNWRPRWKKF